MKIKALVIAFVTGILFTMTGCGGGGGGGASPVNQAPTISSQPTNLYVIAGNNATFTINATGTGLSYQWQEDPASGTFTNVSDAGVYSGSSTATLTLTGVTTSMTGYKYRAVVNGTVAPAATSNSATLTVTAQSKAVVTFSIPTLPANTTVSAVIFDIQLPAGVTPSTMTGTDASASLTFTGAATGTLGAANYDPATRIVRMGGLTLNSFGTGNFLVLNCNIAAGTSVTSSNFSISGTPQVNDINGPIPSATVTISSVQIS